jgi:hypothetical protein
MLPGFLSTIEAAPEGELYKPWDSALAWEDPPQPLKLNIKFHVVQPEAGVRLTFRSDRIIVSGKLRANPTV